MGRAGYLSSRRWAETRRLAFDRDGWKCRKCGGRGRLEAHHEPPLSEREGGDPFDLAGIETLCRRCHLKRHGRGQKPPSAWEKLVGELKTEPGSRIDGPASVNKRPQRRST